MKINYLSFVILLSLFIFPFSNSNSQQLAFPGAEGFGRFTTGGRGGAVYEVTNLNDAGTGSLRDAVSKSGARTIVFRVSGTIQLQSELKISNGNLTIAGQTAPGDGICVAGYNTYVGASNVIIRYMRFRLGKLNVANCECDAFGGQDVSNVIIDHCSSSWSIDETASFYDITNLTVQWCIISESLYNAGHVKGAHGYGGIQGGLGASFHHNLYASHTSRNPRFCGARYHYPGYPSTSFTGIDSTECVDFRNNIIFNWGFNSSYGGEYGTQNLVNNYYKPGPATKSGVKSRVLDVTQGSYGNPGTFYVSGNYMNGNATVTADNWAGAVQGIDWNTAGVRSLKPFPYNSPLAYVSTQTAQDAYTSVLANAGAILPKRDTLDRRIVNETRTGVCAYGGTYDPLTGVALNSTGIIDDQATVGGWPVLNSTTAPTDSDHDGMPDAWETANGLNPNNAADRNTVGADGYTMLEKYLNEGSVQTKYALVPSYGGNGSGYVTLNPAGGSYLPGTVVQITAIPTDGSSFSSWTGGATGTSTTVSVTMDGNKAITANFSNTTYTLTVNKTGTGGGTVTVNPNTSTYSPGSVVTITATPDNGSTFAGWTGDLNAASQSTTVTMNANKTVNAVFNAIQGLKKIAYVTDPTSAYYANDTKILPALKAESRFAVTEVNANSTGIDYSGYDMVILSEVATSTAAGNAAIKGINKPLLMMKPKAYVASWTWATLSTSYGYANQTNMIVSQPAHPIFNTPYAIGYVNSNEVQALSSVVNLKGLTYMDPSAFTSLSNGSVNSIATVKGSSGTTQESVFEIPVGTVVAGTTITQKFLQIGLASDSYANVTTDAVHLVVNACYYLCGIVSTTTDIKSSDGIISIYPNPASDQLTISIDSEDKNVTIRIYNTSGQEIHSKSQNFFNVNQLSISLAKMNPGIYLAVVNTEKETYRKTFIVK